MFTINYVGKNETTLMKDAFASTLRNLMDNDSDVIYLDSDLMNSIGTRDLMDTHPAQAINCGIQEANMMGVAAGMSAVGKKVYAHTFGPFASRRCYDQVFLSAAYAKNPIHVFGSDPGVTAGFNGGTHMPFEDVALYRAMPEAVIFDIVDSVQLVEVMKLIKDLRKVTYIRFPRKNCIGVYGEGSTFEIGKANVLKDGTDVTIIASGIMTAEAFGAAQTLQAQGISAAVIDPVTIKPLDVDTIVAYAKKTGAIVTAENANILGGLGGAVCEALSTHCPTPVEQVGVEDLFGEVGPEDFLRQRFELTQEKIIKKVQDVMKRK